MSEFNLSKAMTALARVADICNALRKSIHLYGTAIHREMMITFIIGQLPVMQTRSMKINSKSELLSNRC